MEILPDLYPLTGFQIGDIQSYVSQAFLYFATESNKILILVDNRPWMMNKHSKSAKIWQLMVTKYRMSPFTNTRALQNTSNTSGSKNQKNGDYESNHAKWKRIHRWFPVINSTKWQEYLLRVMELSKSLHGFIVFEVFWKDVHGINYLNELQTDTSLALEVKSMTKWEFCSPDQASTCISSWFSGKISETQALKKNLTLLSDLDLHQWNLQPSSMHQKPPPSEVHSDDDFLDVPESPIGSDNEKESWSDIAPSQYSDTLILFRFSDCILPLKLRQIIMLDLRLLTLLEAGLPSWVIFFQSYPLFCYFYRPWMRHLTRILYILISLVTVIIGFYDLYKNVPLIKETVARISGPLFGWIEGWEMVSRIRYLGTMLCLSNLRKGLRWFMVLLRTMQMLLLAIIRPLTGPFSEIIEVISPLWNTCAKAGEMLVSNVWFAIAFVGDGFLDLFEFVLWPFELLYSYIWSTVRSVYPLMCSLWELVLVPLRFALILAEYMSKFLCNAFELLKDCWESVCGIFQSTTLSGAKQNAYDMSIWKGLWADLFSQVFRASRGIINGMSAFFMTCNRHRLSIYNHIRAFLRRLACLSYLTSPPCRCRQTPTLQHRHEEEHIECDRCK